MNAARTAYAAVSLIVALLAVPAIVARASSPLTSAEAIALVKATPQLKIDTNAPVSDGFGRKTHPFVEVQGPRKGDSIGGYLTAEYAVQGELSNGETALVIPLESGGSGGCFTQILFVREKGAAHFTFVGHVDSGGHLGLVVTHGSIVARMPEYGPHDPNCCPTKFVIQTFDIENGKLRKIAQKTVPAPPPDSKPGATPKP